VDPILKERSQLLVEKKDETKSSKADSTEDAKTADKADPPAGTK